MDSSIVSDVALHTLVVLFKMTMPILLATLLVGVIMSLLQALTQVQEASVTFVPKLIITFVMFIIMLPFFGETMYNFT